MGIHTYLRNRKNKRGFTLVELMIVVAIIGVLAALAIYGVRKYLLNAKTAEARTALGRISKDAGTAYERERMDTSSMGLGTDRAAGHVLCPDAANTVPATQDLIQGEKYQSDPANWDDAAGWACLKYTMQDPQYFMYNYVASGTGVDGDTYTASAQGDLDGDTILSTYSLIGTVQTGANGDVVLTAAPQIGEISPEE